MLRVTQCRNPLTHDYILRNQIFKENDAVTVHHKLSWNEHICSIVKKASSSIGFLRRNLQIHQKDIKANAYKTLVRPQIEYASTIWDPFTQENQNKIEMVQRRAARFAATTTDAKHLQRGNVCNMVNDSNCCSSIWSCCC